MLTLVNGSGNIKPSCSVKMDSEAHNFNDFVVVACDGNTAFTLMQNTDAVGLGVAAQLLMKAFHDAYVELSEQDRLKVDEYFHGGKVYDYNPGRN